MAIAVFVCLLEEYDSKVQNKFIGRQIMACKPFLFIIIIIASPRVQFCLSCYCCFFRCRNHFDKVFVRAVPVEIIKSVTAAKYNSSIFFIPLYGTATRQTSVRHWYSSMLSNLTVVYTALFYYSTVTETTIFFGEKGSSNIYREKRKNIKCLNR